MKRAKKASRIVRFAVDHELVRYCASPAYSAKGDELWQMKQMKKRKLARRARARAAPY
jgi:hypothetical protein